MEIVPNLRHIVFWLNVGQEALSPVFASQPSANLPHILFTGWLHRVIERGARHILPIMEAECRPLYSLELELISLNCNVSLIAIT